MATLTVLNQLENAGEMSFQFLMMSGWEVKLGQLVKFVYYLVYMSKIKALNLK